MIERTIVGVKLPESGTGAGVDEAVGVGDAEGATDELGEGVGLDVGLAEGVDSKAGPSAA